jgi:hypothetical protein
VHRLISVCLPLMRRCTNPGSSTSWSDIWKQLFDLLDAASALKKRRNRRYFQCQTVLGCRWEKLPVKSGRNLQKLQKARGNLFLVNQSVPSILISSKEV